MVAQNKMMMMRDNWGQINLYMPIHYPDQQQELKVHTHRFFLEKGVRYLVLYIN
jgi:hypothetical protein